MNSGTIKEAMAYLGISTQDLANLLDINLRTTQRWISGHTPIPKATERTLDAWVLLQRLGLPWRPDGNNILSLIDLKRQMAFHKESSIELAEVIKKVKQRGGPAAPWHVNLSSKKATLEKMWVSFYILHNGGFIPQSYGRTDKDLDTNRDRELLEDAFVCIADELEKQYKNQLEAKWEIVHI